MFETVPSKVAPCRSACGGMGKIEPVFGLGRQAYVMKVIHNFMTRMLCSIISISMDIPCIRLLMNLGVDCACQSNEWWHRYKIANEMNGVDENLLEIVIAAWKYKLMGSPAKIEDHCI